VGRSGDDLRRARRAAGLSQAELARRAAVSRALIGAVEHGRHLPAVDAAVRIARVLAVSVESLFDPDPPDTPTMVDGGALPDGASVRAGRVGERVVVAAVDPGEAVTGGWTVPDGAIEDGRLRLFPGGQDSGCVVLGCEPALGVAAALLAGRGPGRLVHVASTTGRALTALDAGRCHGVLVHGPDAGLPEPPVRVTRWHVARWRAGIAYDRALGRPSLEALLSGRLTLVQREASAATEQAVQRASRSLGLDPPSRGPTAAGHLDAAQRAAWITGAAVTMEPAAHAYGLGFCALEIHSVELWVPDLWRAHPGVDALLAVLNSGAFRLRVSRHEGYDLDRCGSLAA
jgi:transcriptional regulator with XRE-family HTH domain